MRIELKFQRRPLSNENVTALNRSLIEELSNIDELWSHNEASFECRLDLGKGESATCDLTAQLSKGLSGQLIYSSRFNVGIDKATFDDRILLYLDSEIFSFNDFVYGCFSKIVKAFSVYRATVFLDEDLLIDDYEEIIGKTQEAESKGLNIDIDGRDSVYRINSVNYFDRLLCQRAFDSSPEDILSKLQGNVEHVSIVNDGVFIIYSSQIIERSELEKIDTTVRALIKRGGDG